MAARPFSPAEQFAFTSGMCHVFAEAAQSRLGGTPTILISTDPRVAEKHDHPADEPLELHVFLTMDDGSVVDAEGRRSLFQLLGGFGLHPEDDHHLVDDPDFTTSRRIFGVIRDPETCPWHRAIHERMTELQWTADDIPPALDVLAKKKAFRQAMEAWHQTGMAEYQASFRRLVESDKEETPASMGAPRRRRQP